MKQYAFLLAALPVALMACNSGKNIPAYQCFAYINGKDSILLQVHTEGKTVDGQLTYQLYEKDQNDGAISGSWAGDTLRAEYQFMSEGIESVREVVFLKKGNQLVEGFGNVEERNGKMVFTSAPSFEQGIVYNTVDCQ
jgi:hypothetical protein